MPGMKIQTFDAGQNYSDPSPGVSRFAFPGSIDSFPIILDIRILRHQRRQSRPFLYRCTGFLKFGLLCETEVSMNEPLVRLEQVPYSL